MFYYEFNINDNKHNILWTSGDFKYLFSVKDKGDVKGVLDWINKNFDTKLKGK